MKKKGFIPAVVGIVFVFLALSCSPLCAEIGFKGGLGFSKVAVSGPGTKSDLNYLKRFNIGVFYNFQFTENLSILTELYYSNKGFKQIQTIGNDENVVKLKLEYIELPVTVKYLMSKQGALHPYLLAGGYAAYKIRAKSHAFTTGSKTEIITDMGEFFKSLDWGVTGGAGVEYLWRDLMRFIIEARYTLGLHDIYKQSGAEDIKFKNRTFSIMLGIGF
jgi:hypothetical protein